MKFMMKVHLGFAVPQCDNSRVGGNIIDLRLASVLAAARTPFFLLCIKLFGASSSFDNADALTRQRFPD